MSTEPVPVASGSMPDPDGLFGLGPTRHDLDLPLTDIGDPTAGMVLHRVLARNARTFLLNDMSPELAGRARGSEPPGVTSLRAAGRPLWAQSAAVAAERTGRRASEMERIHQCRVAMRRIRSNLRTFRLALDPAWGTSLRAELAWYGGRLGEARDLHVIEEMVADIGPKVLSKDRRLQLATVIDARMGAIQADLEAERGGARRFQLTEQMMVLWDGPDFNEKAVRPAGPVLSTMLERAWLDVRGTGRTARKDPTDANLHALRIRLKDLRYGCETVALIEGGQARKTAKAAERLQTQLGELHDARYSIEWLRALGAVQPELNEPIEALAAVQREVAAAARKGWKSELKAVEQRWRAWRG
jgi:CHAD domain-containing protein